MARIYSMTNRIRFTDIPEKYAVPSKFRAKQSDVHSAVIVYVYNHFRNSKKYRQKVVDALNYLTYCIVLEEDVPSYNWTAADPLNTMPEDLDMDMIEQSLGDLCLTDEAIEWDIQETDEPIEAITKPVEEYNDFSFKPKDMTPDIIKQVKNSPVNKPRMEITPHIPDVVRTSIPTPKEDLYIQSPKYPRFDVNKVWMAQNDGSDNLVIYTTLPEVPTRQNEISITTNLEAMTVSELVALYPNHIIHTRSPKMYEQYPNIAYDEDIGCIFPIQGYTKEQVMDNIICYPHLYKLKKVGPDGQVVGFYNTIELNGDLFPIAQVWDELPEAKTIPRDPEFVKEYVVRRYLLEEQAGIRHNYKMFGTLDPFLTLFMPQEKYVEKGYKDTVAIVKQCVTSRIRYKQSRNPILRRLKQSV